MSGNTIRRVWVTVMVMVVVISIVPVVYAEDITYSARGTFEDQTAPYWSADSAGNEIKNVGANGSYSLSTVAVAGGNQWVHNASIELDKGFKVTGILEIDNGGQLLIGGKSGTTPHLGIDGQFNNGAYRTFFVVDGASTQIDGSAGGFHNFTLKMVPNGTVYVKWWDYGTSEPQNWTASLDGSGLSGNKSLKLDSRGTDQGANLDEYTLTQDPNPDEAVISGNVTYHNGTGVEGATISNDVTNDTATTNANGEYSISLPNNDTYKITASKEGYTDNSTEVELNRSNVDGVDFTLVEEGDLSIEAPSHMWHNETDSVVVKDDGTDVTDNATLTSSNTDLLTVSDDGTLESTSNLSRNGEVRITATFEGKSVSKNVTVANLSAEHANLMQNAADMTAALWGDPIHPETGERQGGTQLTMRIIFVATLVGAGFANKINGFAGVAGFLLVITAGWFMNWIGLGLLLLTVVGTLFVGLNTAQLRSRRFGA